MKNTKSKANETVAEEILNAQAAAVETAKTAFDTIIETQNKFVDTFVENTKKFTDNLQATEALNKVRTYVSEWLEKQQGNLENVSETLKTQVRFEQAPEIVKVVVEAQQALGKEWFEALRATLNAEDFKTLQEILNANVGKLQANVREVANFWVENFGKPVNINNVFTTEYAKDLTKKMVEMWTPAATK